MLEVQLSCRLKVNWLRVDYKRAPCVPELQVLHSLDNGTSIVGLDAGYDR
jgi:hypothetical protein